MWVRWVRLCAGATLALGGQACPGSRWGRGPGQPHRGARLQSPRALAEPLSLPPPPRARPRHTRVPSPAWYLFQYHRVLQYARPRPGCPKPFFWMFVDNLVLTREEQTVATRFLEVRAAPPSTPVRAASPGRARHGPSGGLEGVPCTGTLLLHF